MKDDAKTGVRFDRAFESYRAETARLRPYEITIDPTWNPRSMTSPETRAHIESLKLSIKERGILDSVRVRYDPKNQKAILVHGECRVTAARELWDEGFEVLVPAQRAHGDEAELTAQNLASNSGQPLHQDEIGVSCQRLVDWGWTAEKISAYIAKPLRYVTDAIALVRAPLEGKRMVATGQVTAARLLHDLQEHGDEAVTHLKEELATEKSHSRPLPRPKAPPGSKLALQAADALARYIHDNKAIQWEILQELTSKYLSHRQPRGEG